MWKCDIYVGLDDRITRLRDLSLCTRCSSSSHDVSTCYGKQGKLKYPCSICVLRTHNTALCSKKLEESIRKHKTHVNLCYAQRSIDSCIILATMTVTFKTSKGYYQARCLADMGSQRSYISKSVAENIFYDYCKLSKVDQEVHTYIGSVNKTFKQLAATISFGHKLVSIPFLVDDDLNISFEIPSMHIVIDKMRKAGLPLADKSFYRGTGVDLNQIEVDMLLGIDALL